MLKELLKRADLTNIREFIMRGNPPSDLTENKTNEEKINDARIKIIKYLSDNLKEERNDKFDNELFGAINDIQTAYFELGLLSGIKLGFQLNEKTKEIL